jgi:hypothetical protein
MIITYRLYGEFELYQTRLKTSLLSASKFPGFDDRKWFNIRNMDPLTIVESRVFHAAEKRRFQPSLVYAQEQKRLCE